MGFFGKLKTGAKVGVSAAAAGTGGVIMLGAGAAGALGNNSANLFFLLAMFFHFIVDGINRFQTSPAVRFGFYFFMALLGWLTVFKPAGSSALHEEGRTALVKSFILAALAFFLPYLVNIAGIRDAIGSTNINIFLAVMPVYLVYFFFIEPELLGERMQWLRKIYIAIFIIIFANWAYQAGKSQVALGTLEYIPGLQGPAAAEILGVWGDIFSTVWETIREFFTWLIDFLFNMKSRFLSLFNTSIMPEAYSGQTDPNAQQKLGVYIKSIEATDKSFLARDPIGVFATVTANTFDRPLTIKISCKGQSGKTGYDIIAESIFPHAEFTVDRLSQQEIDCNFAAGAFPPGDHKVTMFADFDFETQAYYKTYFVDRERSRTFKSANKDILDVYQVQEKEPKAIFTDGPVLIGMSIGKVQPVELDLNNQDVNRLMLGITLRNRWEGKITAIRSFAIMMPKQLSISGNSCGTIPLSEGSCSDLKLQCDPKIYRVYKLNQEQIQDHFREIQTYKTLRCPVSINGANVLLGNSPLVTEFFRVFTEYTYSLEKSLQVTVTEQ